MSPIFMPSHAPLAALALLGTASLLIACLLTVVAGSVLCRWKWTRRGSMAAVLLAGAYAAILLGSSLASRDRTLKPGDAKYFCELDCHLAYSVESVDLSLVGSQTRYRVSLRTWFDPKTTSPRRGDAPLLPNPRVACLVDRAGNRYPAAPEGIRGLARPLRPGESFATALEFRVPAGVEAPRLFVGDAPGPEALLIGHENAPLHGRIYFALGSPKGAAIHDSGGSGVPRSEPGSDGDRVRPCSSRGRASPDSAGGSPRPARTSKRA